MSKQPNLIIQLLSDTLDMTRRTYLALSVPQISINSPYSKSGKSYGWEYWDSAFYGRKGRKKWKNYYGEKAEKKVEIFSIFSSAFSPYNREYWDFTFYGRKRRKKRDIFSIFISAFSLIKAEINMEKKWRMNMEKLWTSIIFSIRNIEIQACKWLGAS